VDNGTQPALEAGHAPCLSWVKLRRTQHEHMFSALPSNSDIARRSRHVSKVPLTDSCVAANSISNRQSFDRAGAACGISIGRHVLWKFSRLDQKRSTNATGHLLAIFEKPTVAFEARNFCVTSTNIQLEFEIKRRSYTALWAVASASIASDRSISDGMEKIR
jgi:hypothetical protein